MGRISEESIQAVAAANDIVEVIGGYFPLKRAGATFRALCPFHKEKTPSFHVNPHRQSFKCFGCGAGGSVFRFVMDYENLDFPSAVRRLAERAGVPLVEEDGGAFQENRDTAQIDQLRRLHSEAANFYHRYLRREPVAQQARDYLKSRGFDLEAVKTWQIGYAPPEWDACLNWAEQRGFSRSLLETAGLVTSNEEKSGKLYDRFRDRVMFPIFDDRSQVVGFSGRLLDPEAKAAKYVNSPETPLFKKGKLLYGLHLTRRDLIDAGRAIVCEGQVDLITAYQNGVRNVIAPQGTAFTADQARILKRFVQEVVLCFDADAAGLKAAERSIPELLRADLVVRVAVMPAGRDPDTLIREDGAEAFRKIIDDASDFIEFQMEQLGRRHDLQTHRGKNEFAKAIGEAAAQIPSPVHRSSVLLQAAARLGMSEEEIRQYLPRRRPDLRFGDADEKPDRRPANHAVLTDQTLRLLFLTLFHDESARSWVREQDLAPLEELEEIAMVKGLLNLKTDWTNPGAVQASLAAHSGDLEPIAAALFSESAPREPMRVIRDCWKSLLQRRIKQKRDALAARLNLQDLDPGEVPQIQKEILDLQKSLTDISRPLPR